MIDNLLDLLPYIEDYRDRYPKTYTSLSEILRKLGDSYLYRQGDPRYEDHDYDYHIEVCSDWEDKVYVFSAEYVIESYGIIFHFKEIFKL